MFRNRSFRTKLALALTPPLIVLLAMTVALVRPRLDEASAASYSRQEAGLANVNMQYVDELLVERDLSIQALSDQSVAPALAEQRAKTDIWAQNIATAINQFGIDRDEATTLDAVLETVKSFNLIREQYDKKNMGASTVYFQFQKLIETSDALTAALTQGSADPDLARAGLAIDQYLNFKHSIARANSYLGTRLETKEVITNDIAQVTGYMQVAEVQFNQVQELADKTTVQHALDQRSAIESVTADNLRARIINDAQTTAGVKITPAEWWSAASKQLESLDDTEQLLFDNFEVQASAKQTEAQNAARLFAAIAVAAALMAAAIAILFARSISRRLAKISSSAHEISTDRLPEVLEALRNPTPEVLAAALPQVPTDSTDEIGSMAESFNAVLRTSVETSIAHSERRARTLTNILVNLGRRNQALIDRQLELVDALESTQRDPEVLRGLFQLDHMITSLRRNAENLLVLASDTQARSWSEAVPVVDVIRGAVAEVEDMSRIALELDLNDATLLTGRYAVDLSHLLAELVDNSLSFSPPTASVSVRAEQTPQYYRIWMLDSGMGMTERELVEANLRVSNPPDVDELATDRIGFQVVGRLARRLGVSVRLQPNPGGGIAASVTVPASLLETSAAPSFDAPLVPPAAPASASAPTFAPGGVSGADAATSAIFQPAHATDATADRQATRAMSATWDALAEPANRGVTAAPAAPAAVSGLTASGLERRVPGSAYIGDAKAQEFDSGQFRRLPMPGDRATPTDDLSAAQRRLNAMSGLQSGASRARDESTHAEF